MPRARYKPVPERIASYAAEYGLTYEAAAQSLEMDRRFRPKRRAQRAIATLNEQRLLKQQTAEVYETE